MEEQLEKNFDEMLDSVKSINDDFVNKFFSDEVVEENNTSEEVSDEEVQAKINQMEENIDKDEVYSFDEELNAESDEQQMNSDKELAIDEEFVKLPTDIEEDDIPELEEGIKEFENMPTEEEIEESDEEFKEEIEPENLNYEVNLSNDEIIDLIGKTKTSDEFFEAIEHGHK